MRKVLTILFLSIYSFVFAQTKYTIRTVAFYNLENLFDTINAVNSLDEMSPILKMKGNKSEVYWDKIDKLSYVLSQIGSDKTKTSPAIIGVAEVENDSVLTDLINSNHLKNKKYDFIHFNSPDKRGIDVALLYQKKYFKPIHYQKFNPNIYQNNYKIYTRDILWVAGYLDNELVNIIVNHWPSRRGGEATSSHLRQKAAYKVNQIISSIKSNDANAKIIIMGDFNDDPTNDSFKKVLRAKAKKSGLKPDDIYNPFEGMFKKGMNTLGHRDQINLFDQILTSSSLVNTNKNDNYSNFKIYKAGIFNKQFLIQQKGKFKGYPFRSFNWNSYTGGYSDHFPVYIYLIKEMD
ncbi:endonuclease/exonuclease/phosphatase family protein [Tenacibaculum geojense]|uniref:Endonuclease/exonuclease/phosphatase family protein n=1 Tax=Tenacibaculum geojense TaxID=915352 RepID=A0ABW3JUJ5_9FLAO